MAKWIAAAKASAGLRYAVVCPNVTRRTRDRIAKRSGLVLIRSPPLTMMATCGANLYPPGVWFDVSYFSGVTFVLFRIRFCAFIVKPRPFVQSFFDMQAPRQPHGILFPSFVLHRVAVFSLYGEYVVRFSLPDGVFLPCCDHGLDFYTSANHVRIQSFNQLLAVKKYNSHNNNKPFVGA